ncbi:MAG: site-2 protease family protein [Kofleriaceae bacterium]|nr:site-2 protease family protein [Myxococcales bacterium]MCB9564070.1 site-2 protease family protein [Kofleriaceae bacterium]MCB9572561.1 site-2 protease family protein [Kofleriaceae bacterium]
MDFSPANMRWVVQAMIILLLSICVHEFGHAYVADRLGDDLPRRQGRVSLNPLVHADLIGTVAFPLIGLLYMGGIGFGWGKPVQVQPTRFSRRFAMRTGHMFVAFAGPLMNLMFGTLIAIVHVALLKWQVIDYAHPLNRALHYAVGLNFILFFFNLVPAPPLDGGAVTEGLLPSRYLPAFQKFSVYGPFVLMAVILIPELSRIFTYPANLVTVNLYDLLAQVFSLR